DVVAALLERVAHTPGAVDLPLYTDDTGRTAADLDAAAQAATHALANDQPRRWADGEAPVLVDCGQLVQHGGGDDDDEQRDGDGGEEVTAANQRCVDRVCGAAISSVRRSRCGRWHQSSAFCTSHAVWEGACGQVLVCAAPGERGQAQHASCAGRSSRAAPRLGRLHPGASLPSSAERLCRRRGSRRWTGTRWRS